MKPRFLLFLVVAAFLCHQAAEAVTSRAAADRGPRRPAPQREGTAQAASEGRSPCEDTAKVANKACRSEAYDDFYTQQGNCLNLEDPEAAAECEDEAGETLAEDLEQCRERLEARLEVCDLLGEYRYDPAIDPASFVSAEEIAAQPNPYFPLVPGNRWVYQNEEETITVTVTDETLEILGVTCVEVRDVVVLTATGDVIEETLDWYAQDLEGNLWYFGEIAKGFEDGLLHDLDGSWRAGSEFAKPGILLPAAPYPGQAYRQEFLLREAEDIAQVVSLTAFESTDFVECDGGCLQNLEGTPIEPDVAEYKYYLPGLGLILEVDVETGDRTELVDFTSE